jgi:hypothetical protein
MFCNHQILHNKWKNNEPVNQLFTDIKKANYSFRKGFSVIFCFFNTTFNFVLEYAIMKVQENQKELKLNWTHQFWSMLMMLIYWAKTYTL